MGGGKGRKLNKNELGSNFEGKAVTADCTVWEIKYDKGLSVQKNRAGEGSEGGRRAARDNIKVVVREDPSENKAQMLLTQVTIKLKHLYHQYNLG